MRKILIGCALLIGMGSPLPVSAQDIELEIGRDGLRLGDGCNPRFEDCRRGRRSMGRFCTPDRALDRADRMGVRRARIADVGRRTIQVSGRDRFGDRVRVTFGREPGCPVLRRR
jgi:hypothetical protein